MKIQGGGLAAWSIKHPIGVTMIAATVIVLGLAALSRLSIDLLPQIIYPDIRVRILDEGGACNGHGGSGHPVC